MHKAFDACANMLKCVQMSLFSQYQVFQKTVTLSHKNKKKQYSTRQTTQGFLDASSHLYMRLCPSVGPSVGPLIRRSIGPSVMHSSETCKSCSRQSEMIWNRLNTNMGAKGLCGELIIPISKIICSISKIICPIPEKNPMDPSLFRLELVSRDKETFFGTPNI